MDNSTQNAFMKFSLLIFLLFFSGAFLHAQEVTLAEYKFASNGDMNPETNAIGAPGLTRSNSVGFSGSYGNGFSSLYTNTDGGGVGLSISTVGYQDIKVEWDGGYWFGQTGGRHDWVLTANSGAGYGPALFTQNCNSDQWQQASQTLSSVFDNNANISIRITADVNGGRYVYLDNLKIKGIPITPISPPEITAVGDQSFCPGSDPVNIAETISIDTKGVSLTEMSVQISGNYKKGEDFLELSSPVAGITDNWDADAGKLTLTGSVTDALFETAIGNVQYKNTNPLPTKNIRTFSITFLQANYLPGTGHFYEFVPSVGIRWDDARDAASSKTYYGLQGYLATLTSQEESDLAGAQISGAGWIGASDAATEGDWKWVTGPEAGTSFWSGLGSANGGSVVTGQYANWNGAGEPNDAGGEDYAHITDPSMGVTGTWNDLSVVGGSSGVYQPKGYVVEYGGTSGDPELSISASTVLTVKSNAEISLSSSLGTDVQNICLGNNMTAITYSLSDETNAIVTGLPAGLSGAYASGSFTISGTPSEIGVFLYTIAVIGDCANAETSGSIIVNALPVVSISEDLEICSGDEATLTVDSTDYSMTFDGLNDYLAVPNSPDINTSIQTQRTVMLWFKPSNITSRQVLYEEGGGTHGLSIYIESGTINAYAWVSGNAWSVASGVLSGAGEWYHFTYTWDGASQDFKAYLNGKLVDVITGGNSMPAHPGDVRIGSAGSIRLPDNTTDSGFAFEGRIDNFRLWNSELSQIDILKEISSSSALVSNDILDYNFDDPIDTTTALNSGSADNAVISNGAFYTSDNAILWNDAGATTNFSLVISPLSTKVYTATITNENGCQEIGNVSLTVTPKPGPIGIFSE
ncbi:MAG: LamG-like jellyroll fold domain-containing protein [Labilibaculum antarcticum]